MMWALAIKNKLTAALLLCGVMVVLMVTNFGTRNNSEKINTAVASIYEDRLVVEGYIFEYAKALNRIEQIAQGSEQSIIRKHRTIIKAVDGLDELNALYAATKLTDEESSSFNAFTALCTAIKQKSAVGDAAGVQAAVAEAQGILTTLSSIQMAEAKSQMENVTRLNSFADLLSQLELVMVIVVAVLMVVLISASNTMRKVKLPDNVHLN